MSNWINFPETGLAKHYGITATVKVYPNTISPRIRQTIQAAMENGIMPHVTGQAWAIWNELMVGRVKVTMAKRAKWYSAGITLPRNISDQYYAQLAEELHAWSRMLDGNNGHIYRYEHNHQIAVNCPSMPMEKLYEVVTKTVPDYLLHPSDEVVQAFRRGDPLQFKVRYGVPDK